MIQALSSINKHGKIHGIDFSEQAVNDTTRVNREDVATGKVIVSQASDVQEVFRVLKHGGKFVMMSEIYKINYHRKDYKTNAELKQLMQSIGFQSITIQEQTTKGWISVMATK